jgi:phosphatidylglycerophosphate synthase
MTAPAGRWSELHHGIDPSGVPLLGTWLRLMWWLARPVVRVPPIAFTALGVLLALDAVLLAGPLPWVALALVLGAVLCDGLDGAVAVLAGRATRAGAAADAVADRVSDAAFAAVLWQCGAPWWLALGCGVLAFGVDGLRRVRHVPARITVAERPTWTVCTVLACGSAGVTSVEWPVSVCAGVWAAAGLTGLAQLSRA